MKISDDELIIALLAGGSVRRAAKVLCISPQAITKRLKGDLGKRYEEERLRLFGNISDEHTEVNNKEKNSCQEKKQRNKET